MEVVVAETLGAVIESFVGTAGDWVSVSKVVPSRGTEVECVACPCAPTWKLRIGSLDVTGHGSEVLVLVQAVEVGVEEFLTEICLAAMPGCLGYTVRSDLATPWWRSETSSAAM